MFSRLHPNLLTLVLALAVIGGHATLLVVRGTATTVSGDEGTFLAMTASLAFDGDLAFSDDDASRLEGGEAPGRKAVILQRTASGLAYSKPAVFPLLAAPWFRLFGELGVVVLNALALGLATLMGAAFLRRRTGEERVGTAVVVFIGTGVLLSYVVWSMSDSLQASMVLAGLAAGIGVEVGEGSGRRLDRFLTSPWSAVVGGVLLGLAAGMRYPNLLLGMAVPAALLLQRRVRRALLAAAILFLTLSGSLVLNQQLTGALVPYKAVRATFNAQTGYPVGPGAEELLGHFDEARATHRLGALPTLRLRTSLYSGLYFFVGRHTGLLVYGTAALIFAWLALRRRDPVGLAIVGAAVALGLFYVLWMPRNYFGGGTFLGNRYFLTAQAALMLAPRRLPRPKALIGILGVALVVFVSALVSSARTRESDGTSQMHAHAGLFRVLPYETTASNLDGRKDRYWHFELVRFVDPFVKVREHGFRLMAGDSPTELVTANGRDHGVVRLLVRADAPEVDLVYRDWAQTKRFRLQAQKGQKSAGGLVEILPSIAIRRHPYWWDEETSLKIRSFRLQLVTPDGSPATAEVRYAGPYRFVPRFYRGDLEETTIPRRGVAGGSRRIAVRVRNTGTRYWATADSIPVFLGYRMYRLIEGKKSEAFVGPLTRLPERVEAGGLLEAQMKLVMPDEPGVYWLEIDLVVGGVSWFAEWSSEPLAKGEIRVREPPSSET